MNLARFKHIELLCWGIFVFAAWLVVRFGLHYNGLYGQDAHEYYRYSQALFGYFQRQTPPGDYFWPVNYPLYGALLTFLTGDNLLALQGISILSFLATGWLLRDIILQIFPPADEKKRNTIFIYITITWFLSPMLWRTSTLVMSDMLGIALTSWAIWAYIRFNKHPSASLMAVFGFAAAAAVMTRYGAAVVLVLPGLVMLRSGLRSRQWIGLVLAAILAIICVLPHIWIRGQNSGAFLGHAWLQHWSVAHWFERIFDTQDGRTFYRLPNLLYSLMALYHPGFSILCSAAIAVMLFLNRRNIKISLLPLFPSREITFVLTGSFIIYALFLAGIPFQNSRFVMAGYPLLILIAFPAFDFLYAYFKNNYLKISLLTAFSVLQICLLYTSFKPFYQRNKLEIALADAIKDQPSDTLYTFAVDMALKSYHIPQHCLNLWIKKYDSFDKGALVLFNEKAFAKQWEGKNPMINWNRLRQDYQLDTVKVLPEGWILYQIR